MQLDLAAARPRTWRDLRYSATDGTALYARDYGDRLSTDTPVVCLAGLTRTSRDFDDLAMQLSGERRVLAPDYRGRGLSQRADARSYTPFHELLDVLSLIDAAGVEEAVFIATSRGGLIVMLMAAMRPAAMRGVVLNDVGPVIEPAGLLRIVGYLNHAPSPENWSHAAEILKQIHGQGFPDLQDEDWHAFARRTYADRDGRPVADVDPRLIEAVSAASAASKGHVAPMWQQFAALSRIPLLAIRGANSDLLGEATLERMGEVHPHMKSLEIAGRGHAPFLDEPEAVRAIRRLLTRVDRE